MRFLRTLMPLVAIALVSCDSLDVGDDQAVALFLELSTTTIPLGGSIQATVTVQNVGSDEVLLSGPSDCLLYIEVLNSSATRVYSSAFACSGATVTESLAPGLERTATTTWDGTSNQGSRLPPGDYHLRPVVLLTSGAYAQPGANVNVE